MIDFIGELRRIMNASAAETYDPATDSLEAIANAIGAGPGVGLWMLGRCDAAMAASLTVVTTDNLGGGLPDNVFNNEFWMQVIHNASAPGTAPEGEIRRITDFVGATQTFTVDAFTANVEAGDLLAIFHESVLPVEILARGTLDTSSATVPADSARTEANNHFRGCLLMTTEGAVRFQPRRIVEYTGVGGIFILDPANPFTAAPGLVDYIVIGSQTEFVPAADAAVNRTPADVIGNKSDAAVTVVGVVASIMAYIKGILNTVLGLNTGVPRVQEVIIYPVAEDAGVTELADDGTSPAYYPAVAASTAAVGEGAGVAAWTEDINLEQEGTITLISIYAEFEWQSRFLVGIGNGTNSGSKIQMSRDGGASWVDVTDNFVHNAAVMTNRIRAGVGLWVPTIVAGANQLQFRLLHWVDVGTGISTSEAQIRSNSYVRLTYRKS